MSPQFDALSNQQRETILNDFRSLADDTDLSVSITYKRQTGSSYDAETGDQTLTQQSDTVNALRTRLNAERAAREGAEVEEGDIVYFIDKADLGTTPPTTDDTLDDSGTTRHVVDWREDPLAQWYVIFARQV